MRLLFASVLLCNHLRCVIRWGGRDWEFICLIGQTATEGWAGFGLNTLLLSLRFLHFIFNLVHVKKKTWTGYLWIHGQRWKWNQTVKHFPRLSPQHRCCSPTNQELQSGETYFRETDPSRDTSESTTLHILSPGRVHTPRELYVTETQDEAYHGGAESDTELTEGTPRVRTQLCLPSLGERSRLESLESKGQPASLGGFSPGEMVELQLSLSEQSLDDPVCSSLGSARRVEGAIQTRESEALHTATHSLYIPCPAREPLAQHGVVLSHPALLGQVEVILQHPAPGTGCPAKRVGAGDLGAGGSVGSGGEGEEGGGHSEEAPASFCVSFGIPSEGGAPAEEWDSDSELSKPSKHRAKHARK